MTTPAPDALRPSTPAIPLSAVAGRIGADMVPGDALSPTDPLVNGITHDSRAVRPGDVYAALSGANHHGADFVSDAVARGALAILTDASGRGRARASGVPVLIVDDTRRSLGAAASVVYGDPAASLAVLGITGTNGKTTTAYLLEAALRADGRRTGLIGTITTLIDGEPITSVRTTPEATDLHALLAVMLERGVDTVVMEVSSHALVLGRVDAIMFDVVGFTNLSQDHLDFHATMEDYFDAKASLFTRERARRGVSIIEGGADEGSWRRRLLERATIPMVAVVLGDGSVEGLKPSQIKRVHEKPLGEGQQADVVGVDGTFTVHTALIGRWNLENAVLAAVMAQVSGVQVEAATHGIHAVVGVPGRLQEVFASNHELGIRAFIDYAHTPDAVNEILTELRRAAAQGRRLIAVIGCGGDRDHGKRPLMGAAAARHADFVIVTDDNPRSESPGSIRDAVLAGARSATSQASIMDVGDRRRAIEAAVTLASPDGVIAVLGKGHETGQEVAGVIAPFDDRLVLQSILDSMTARP